MKLDSTTSEALRKFVVAQLELLGSRCDVDPTSEKDLKETCIVQLDDFLREKPLIFVESIFEYLAKEGALHPGEKEREKVGKGKT
ncbi:hypothetical protein BC829DRAFT_393077 [Chytridium lagenaria]|nr:hypothetical protein BC829DRAFT_393077 [Chytridium lagenaria]